MRLLVDKYGKKIGKTTHGISSFGQSSSPFLNNPYLLYQYLVKTPDSLLKEYFLKLTVLSVTEIEQVLSKHNNNPSKQLGQESLAKEVMSICFNRKIADNVAFLSKQLYRKQITTIHDLKKINNFIDYLPEISITSKFKEDLVALKKELALTLRLTDKQSIFT